MTSFLPSSTQGTVLLAVIGIMFILTIYLPWKKKTSATGMISISIIVVFILQLLFTSDFLYDLPFMQDMEMVSQGELFREMGLFPRSIVDDTALYQMITSTYIHANFMHLIFNFIGLFLLGVQLERKIGWERFLVIYFGSGIIAGALVLIISPFDVVGHSMKTASIGASGCIFGILGGYWFLYPRDKIFFPLPLLFIRMTYKWPVSLIFLIYGGITAFYLLVGSGDNTSHIGHFGGLIGAFPIAALVRPPEKKSNVKRIKRKDLESLARTKKQKDYLQRALDADEQDVRNAWLDEFFRSIKCPKCQSSNMIMEDGRGVCPKCGKIIKP